MLHQTQAARVAARYDTFVAQFPTPAAMAAAAPADVISAWGRLGYPRRARWLWEAARRIDAHGWPDDLRALPGVGRYTAAAVLAQVDDADTIGVEVNVRRVCERVRGARLSPIEAERAAVKIAAPLTGRDRLLALMDLGAVVCVSRTPACAHCPIVGGCVTRGALADETRHRQAAYAGSFRQRRGQVLARLRVGPVRTVELDGEALATLLDDGLAEVTRGRAHLPRA
jgi:A/G-specific adenine glycosylase